MPTNHCFEQRFADSIVSILSCPDRVIFKGHLPFGGDGHLNRFVDDSLEMLRKDVLPFVEEQSEALVVHARSVAEKAGAPYEYLQGRHNKEKLIQSIIHKRGLSEGLVAVLCTQECCRTVKLLHDKGRPRLVFRPRPQRVLYYYFLDPDFGLIYLRLQSWFPFTMQVYVNGHDWLARQMAQRRLGFVQHDNAFTQLDQPDKAQQLAERFPHLDWVKILDRWARQINPLLRQAWLRPGSYYWVIDQAEYSTDVLFRDRASLAELYPRLLVRDHLHGHELNRRRITLRKGPPPGVKTRLCEIPLRTEVANGQPAGAPVPHDPTPELFLGATPLLCRGHGHLLCGD